MSEKNIDELEQGTASMEVAVKEKWPGWPGHNVFRILVPELKVGALIDHRGEFIKRTYQETKARVIIFDRCIGTSQRTVLISAKEEPDFPIPPAINGLLKVHQQIIDASSNHTICSSLLVPHNQALNLIEKNGATVNAIGDSSNCTIKVDPKGDRSVFALTDDHIVYIQGEPANVHKAIELIARHLRKFLVDQGVIEILEKEMEMADGNDRTISSKDPSVGSSRAANMQPPKSRVTKVTWNLQIPVAYADAVIGTSGVNISFIRRTSGAIVIIHETRVVPGEMTIEISGSPPQVEIAQQLLQDSMKEADIATQSSTARNYGGSQKGNALCCFV